MNKIISNNNTTIYQNTNVSKLSSKQKLSLMLLNKHFNINTFDAKLSNYISKNLLLHKKSFSCLPFVLKPEVFYLKSQKKSSLEFVTKFSIFFCLSPITSELSTSFLKAYSLHMINNYYLNIVCFKKLYSLYSVKNAKYFFLLKKLKLLKKSFNSVYNLFTSSFLLNSFAINNYVTVFNELAYSKFNFYTDFLTTVIRYSKLSSYLFLFSFLKSIKNSHTMSAIFFRFYFAYKFKLLDLSDSVFNVFSYNTFAKNPYFWLAFNKDNLSKFNIPIDYSFLKYMRSWTVTNTLSFIESSKNIDSYYLNYAYIANSNYSYSNFLNHLIGLITKRGLRLKSFKVVFLLSLKLFKLTSDSSFLSSSLSKIQPMFRVLKTKSRGKAKVIPQGLTASKLYSFSYTTLVKHSRLRSENTILLKLFSEILDISVYKGASLKTKVSNLKLFIQNKYNISSSSSSSQLSSKRYRNKQIL